MILAFSATTLWMKAKLGVQHVPITTRQQLMSKEEGFSTKVVIYSTGQAICYA
jgi:hypothetical protein